MTLPLPPTQFASVETRTPLEAAILRTVLYADVFEYALTLKQIHRYLIGVRASMAEVQTALAGRYLKQVLEQNSDYYCLRERGHILTLRSARQQHSAQLWSVARRWAVGLGALPFVRLVGVTGALAMDNVLAQDDVDVLLVTQTGRVWLARFFAVALVRLARLFGVNLCPNYVLAETALAQTQHDLYTAHDLTQMVPLIGHSMYVELRAANRWTHSHLPNADEAPMAIDEVRVPLVLRWAQRVLEGVLSGAFGDWFEAVEHRAKQRKFASLITSESAAQLDADHVKGHFQDHGRWVLEAYAERLKEFGLG